MRNVLIHLIRLGLACLWASLSANIPAADAPLLKIQTGKKTIEMPDTSAPARQLDLARYELKLLCEADFSKPLNVVKEASLFQNGQRVRQPAGAEWVLEGQASAFTTNGLLHLRNEGSHLVCWNTREFPASFLLEFAVAPTNVNLGLNIIFFAAKGKNGESIFDVSQPLRAGEFKTYHSGALNCYHVSYWAVDPAGKERGTTHFRKNAGFHLVAAGRDFIAGQGPGPHRVRLLKVGPHLTLEVNGKISCEWEDDAKLGPVPQGGLIGLRQMEHTGESTYAGFKVWSVQPRP